MFFKYFPTINYKADGYDTPLTDISIAFIKKKLFADSAYLFRRYTIIEGETPEAVSYKLYGTTRFHWTLIFMNDIVDVMTDWFMSSDLLLEFTEAKYPLIENDITNSSGVFGIHHYRWYYDEKDSKVYQRLDDIDDKRYRYKGGRGYTTNDIIVIDPPNLNEPENRATAYINSVDDIGAITDIVITNRGSNYSPVATPGFHIESEKGYGFTGEVLTEGSSEVKSILITPIGEQIHPITNLHCETELNTNRREIIAISPNQINAFESQFYYIMENY